MDPVGWLDRSLPDLDLELLSFLLQGISYGRVEQIQVSYLKLLKHFTSLGIAPNGQGLREWIKNNDPKSAETTRALKGWKHRLNTHADLQNVLQILKENFVDKDISLAESFNQESSDTFESQIFKFCDLFENTKKRSSKKWIGTGPQWFAPNPALGGTSKRLMMWLRWMIREDGIDLGLWKRMLQDRLKFDQSNLYIPVDTHVFRFARQWKLVSQKSPNWKAAKSITEALRRVDPADPVRFDFAICHAGKLAARAKL